MITWMEPDAWAEAQRTLPILCVDVLPVRRDDRGHVAVGLILRDTPHQGRRWCLVGGRLHHGETLRSALTRELESALITVSSEAAVLTPNPLLVEYLPDARPGQPHDPRKHAVAATFAAELGEVAGSRGTEALSFDWFGLDALNDDVMGFGQDKLLLPLLQLAGLRP